MKYYVEINGESSLNIQGLAIQSLPPISKPLMRSKQETIDGRDGDVITKLGYAAYDKTLKIGLWGNYDINEIITFFNQEGEIVFSSEPDKYYRFTILNRDDYINQLEIFKTATIILHCQPYKYLLNEEPKEMENEYITETNVSSATFENTLEAPMNIDLKGNTLQNGTPTPSSPIPINNVSGDNDIVVCGKNVVNWNNVNWYRNNNNDYTYISDNSTTRVKSSLIEVSGGTYTISGIPSVLTMNNSSPYCYDSNKTYLGDRYATFTNNTITIPSNVKYIALVLNGTDLTNAIKTTLSNSNMQLEVGNQPSTYEAYNGTTYNIDLPVENLFDKDNANIGAFYIYNNKILASTVDKMIILGIKPNTTYTIQKGLNATQTANRFKVGTCVDSPANNVELTNYVGYGDGTQVQEITITSGANDKYLVVQIANNQANYDEIKGTIQIEYGSKANTYTSFGTTPIELNKIGTYQDYFYKENDKWYLHKEIGKVVIDGNNANLSAWGAPTQTNTLAFRLTSVEGIINNTSASANILLLSNRYLNNPNSKQDYLYLNDVEGFATFSSNLYFRISKNIASTIETLKTWLSSNNLDVYYPLNTPTNTEITYTPLIEQLNTIEQAQSKEGTTNVNQVNNDAPFMLDLSVLSGSDTLTINNIGNAPSKPVITLVGSGNVGLYLNDIQVFQISLGTNETIILDTENMEAYYGSQLKNRQVIGDYNNFALQSGENTIRFTGSVSYIEITNYTRWI